MSTLSLAILGLGQVGASVGLALRRYMRNNGKYQFKITGHGANTDVEKQALKLGVVDKVERRASDAVRGADIVVLAMPFDEVRDTFGYIAGTMRAGAVVLDLSTSKHPSIRWAAEVLDDEQHLVGMTPIINPRYMYSVAAGIDEAREDLFDDGAILLTPAANAMKEAVDLAFNFASLLGSQPRFLDPVEHDQMLVLTEVLPALLGTAYFFNLTQKPFWDDLQRFTNASFGALTRPLFDIHPDAMRDLLLENRESLTRGLDELLGTLKGLREALASQDRSTIEAVTVNASENYEKWVNKRTNNRWDDRADATKVDASNTMMGALLGQSLARRLTGKKDQDES